MKPYRLQLVQALTHADKGKRMEFCAAMLDMEGDDDIVSRIIFNDETTFQQPSTSMAMSIIAMFGFGKPNTHVKQLSMNELPLRWMCSVRWVMSGFMALSSSRTTLSQDKAISKYYEPGSSLCCKCTLMTSFSSKMEHHPFGACQCEHFLMEQCLNGGLVAGVLRIVLSPHGLQDPQTSLRFLPVGHTSRTVFMFRHYPLHWMTLTLVINSADRDMLQRVWEEFAYLLDVVRAVGGGHIEHL